MKTIGKIQIGKQGITENFIKTLKSYFKNHQNVRVYALKSSLPEEGRKERVKKYSEEILAELGKNYTSKIIGFTIIVKKWRREVR